GQDGPYIKNIYTKQTIRRKLGQLYTTFEILYHNVTMYIKETTVSTNNPPITKAPSKQNINSKFKTSLSRNLSMWVGISEAIRLFSTNKPHDYKFYQWLAGLIDGNGCFQLSKKGYASLEIVMETRDKHCLYQIKQKFGGSIKVKSDVNWLRYRLHDRQGLTRLINSINGLIRNPNRLLQLAKLCEKYEIKLLPTENLIWDSAWLSGFFDSDGSIYFNLESHQVFITACQKNKFILDDLVKLYGGNIYVMVKQGAFKWTVFRKDDILKLKEYFNLNKSRSAKQKRINLLDKYYDLRKHKAHILGSNVILNKEWNKFLKDWENYK
uniref:hypothetical protein n=1 Tax=Gonatophragmium mori TaxID=2966219 RepID=UPI0023D8A802